MLGVRKNGDEVGVVIGSGGEVGEEVVVDVGVVIGNGGEVGEEVVIDGEEVVTDDGEDGKMVEGDMVVGDGHVCACRVFFGPWCNYSNYCFFEVARICHILMGSMSCPDLGWRESLVGCP